jgi:hypothetical protein
MGPYFRRDSGFKIWRWVNYVWFWERVSWKEVRSWNVRDKENKFNQNVRKL